MKVMEPKKSPNRADRLWAAVEERSKALRGGKRLVEKLRRNCANKESDGPVAACIDDGPLFEHAVDVLSSEIEKMSKMEAAKLAKDKFDNAVESLWVICAEDCDFDPDANLRFDPASAAIRVGRDYPSFSVSSAAKSLDSLAKLVSEALESPLAAGNMVEDFRLPWWLRRLAENLKVESAGDVRPKFRGLVECWVSDPEEAREWAEFAEGKLPRWAVEAAQVLGSRESASG